MLEMYNSSASKDKKLVAEARQMLEDAKDKIEYIKMQMLRLQQKADGDSELIFLFFNSK